MSIDFVSKEGNVYQFILTEKASLKEKVER